MLSDKYNSIMLDWAAFMKRKYDEAIAAQKRGESLEGRVIVNFEQCVKGANKDFGEWMQKRHEAQLKYEPSAVAAAEAAARIETPASATNAPLWAHAEEQKESNAAAAVSSSAAAAASNGMHD